jgi:two-component system sensor histidine kinase RegB
MRMVDRLPLGALLDEMASPHRSGDLAVQIECASTAEPALPQPKVWRSPALLHGLGNVIANAADFANARVRIVAQWDENDLRISVQDDGPGFAPDIIERIGEPYVTSRPGSYALGETELSPNEAFAGQQGMGLGFFIAKTLIEQTGGTIRARNLDGKGARVSARWPRGAIDGEKPPGRSSLG